MRLSTYTRTHQRNEIQWKNPIFDHGIKILKFARARALSPFLIVTVLLCGMFISRVFALCHGTYQTIIWLFRVGECACGACAIHFATPLIILYAQRHKHTRIWSSQFNWKVENWSEKNRAHGQGFFHSDVVECDSFFMRRCLTGCILLEKIARLDFPFDFL